MPARRWRCWGRPDVPVITRDMVEYAKPDPDLFLAAAERLGVSITNSVVVGDSVWDLLAARRAGPSGSACSPAATGRTSWNAPAPTGSIRIRKTCYGTSTRSACAVPR